MCYKKIFLFIGVSILMVCNSTKGIGNTEKVAEKGNNIINYDKKLIIEDREDTRASRSNFECENNGIILLPIEDINETIVLEGL